MLEDTIKEAQKRIDIDDWAMTISYCPMVKSGCLMHGGCIHFNPGYLRIVGGVHFLVYAPVFSSCKLWR